MSNDLTEKLFEVAEKFQLRGKMRHAEPYGNGHINDTFIAVVEPDAGDGQRYIFQRLNDNIFHDIPALMNNISRVCDHVGRKAPEYPTALRQRPMTLIPTCDGCFFVRDSLGNHWRVYEYLEGTETIEIVEDVVHARESARAFAVFLEMKQDLPGPRLQETIPHFHDTPMRLTDLERAVVQNPAGRRDEVVAELEFVERHRDLADILTGRLRRGEIPERVTHNDTKINNIRFDCETGRGAAVIDLDTVMPGLVHYDFGDMIRTTVFSGAEDETDLDTVQLRPQYMDALYTGFQEGASSWLTPNESETLALAGPIICFEIGVRFLTDYLNGDVYFKTHRPAQNLDRARVQFRRTELLENQGR